MITELTYIKKHATHTHKDTQKKCTHSHERSNKHTHTHAHHHTNTLEKTWPDKSFQLEIEEKL